MTQSQTLVAAAIRLVVRFSHLVVNCRLWNSPLSNPGRNPFFGERCHRRHVHHF